MRGVKAVMAWGVAAVMAWGEGVAMVLGVGRAAAGEASCCLEMFLTSSFYCIF